MTVGQPQLGQCPPLGQGPWVCLSGLGTDWPLLGSQRGAAGLRVGSAP